MKMQFQMSSMRTIGDPVMHFTIYPGRFASAHLQGVDTTAGMNPIGRGTLTVKPTPEQLAAQEAAGPREPVGAVPRRHVGPPPALAGQPRVLPPRRLVAEVPKAAPWRWAKTPSTGSRYFRPPRSVASRTTSSSRVGTSPYGAWSFSRR